MRENNKEKGDDMSGFKKLIAAAGAGLIMTSVCAASVSASESYDPYSYDRWGDAVASQVGYTAERSIDGQLINGLYEKVESMEGFDYDEESWKNLLNFKEPSDIYISADELIYLVDTGY